MNLKWLSSHMLSKSLPSPSECPWSKPCDSRKAFGAKNVSFALHPPKTYHVHFRQHLALLLKHSSRWSSLLFLQLWTLKSVTFRAVLLNTASRRTLTSVSLFHWSLPFWQHQEKHAQFYFFLLFVSFPLTTLRGIVKFRCSASVWAKQHW